MNPDNLTEITVCQAQGQPQRMRPFSDPTPLTPKRCLADSWPDTLNFARPRDVWRFVKSILGRPRRVELDFNHAHFAHIPKYAQLEYHGLPNGYYSKRVAAGYIKGFDRSMLGAMAQVRSTIAAELADCNAVLDVGCSGGRGAAALLQAGVEDVWGVDLCPYLLEHACVNNADARFVDGLAEALPFAQHRFDGLSVCFLFHEMPPRYIRQALREFYRVLRPGGRIVIAEPHVAQYRDSFRALLRRYGLRGLYFGVMARRIYEPFVRAWHDFDIQHEAAQAGFGMTRMVHAMPVRYVMLEKPATH